MKDFRSVNELDEINNIFGKMQARHHLALCKKITL